MNSIYNLFADIADVMLAFCLLVFLPLALLPSKRKFSGRGLKIASAVFLLQLWAYSLGALWHYWGLIAVILGILLTPLAALVFASADLLLHNDWAALLNLVLTTGITVGAYWGGDRLEQKAEEHHLMNG